MTPVFDPSALSPQAALDRLQDGNRRFRDANEKSVARQWSHQMAHSQKPFAIVLGCSDSRTPVEILFDQGFGDLFVVRVAGNIVAPSIVGSIEFAAAQFGSRLVVVMGHSRCGAIAATLRAIETGNSPESKNIRAITDRIAPHIADLVVPGESDKVIHDAVRANVRASVDHLRHGSQILEDLVLAGQLVVVGAEYELDTGAVQFFDTGVLQAQPSS